MERGRETIFGGLPCRRSLSPRVSPSRAPVFSCAHLFQAPATQAISRSNGGRGRQGEKRGGRDKFGVEIGSSLLYFLLVALSLDHRQFLSLLRFVTLNLSFSLRRDCSGGCSSFKTTSSPSSTCMDAILFIYMTSLPREVRIDFWKGVARKIGRDTVTRANFLKIRHFMFHVTRQPTFKATSLREKSR